jgi:NADPH:quinone reductase-like Zn-dependent oxidoreductase
MLDKAGIRTLTGQQGEAWRQGPQALRALYREGLGELSADTLERLAALELNAEQRRIRRSSSASARQGSRQLRCHLGAHDGIVDIRGSGETAPQKARTRLPAPFPTRRPEETIHMKAIVVTDQAAGTAGMKLVERPEPPAAINDVIVRIHASGFVPTELAWSSTWTDRRDRDRTPSIPGHELAGVVTVLGYGTTGLSVGQRVFGLADWHRDGTLAEYVAIEARNLAPLPGDVDFTVGASLPISGLTAWQGLFQHGRLRAGQSVLAHGAAGAVGSMVTQLAREAGGYVIGTGRAADRQKALDFGAQEFVDLGHDALEDVGGVDLVFDVIGGDIQKRSAGLIRAGGTLVSIVGPTEARPADGLAVDFVVEPDRAQLSEIVQRVRDGRLRTNIGNVSALDDAVAAFNATERRAGKTVIRVRP